MFQLTIASGFLDLSQLYGSNAEEAASLREEKSGRLIVEKRNNQEWPPIIKSQYGFCNGTTNVCYKSGENFILTKDKKMMPNFKTTL